MRFWPILLIALPTIVFADCANNPLYQKLKTMTCNPKQIHLTFDDGPRAVTTPAILEELTKRKIKGTFFVSTTNLVNSPANQALVNTLMQSGQYIASHGHEHNCYDHRYDGNHNMLSKPFTEKEREEQVKKSDDLLNKATNGKFSKQKYGKFFRFPYGRGAMPSPYEIELMKQKGMTIKGADYKEQLAYYRQHSPAMSSISEYGYSHMGWNFDSEDSSYGAEISDDATVEKYLTTTLTSMCKSRDPLLVALFHDIKKLNAKSIGPLIDTAQCLGMSFVSIDETLAKRQTLVDSGVIINKYELTTEKYKELLSTLDEVNQKPKLTCDPKPTGNKKGCYSEYAKKEIPHCQGEDSICVDGNFYARGSLITHTECGIELKRDKIEINQAECKTPSESKVVVPDVIKCYCQETGNDLKLRWNCYDISQVPAVKI